MLPWFSCNTSLAVPSLPIQIQAPPTPTHFAKQFEALVAPAGNCVWKAFLNAVPFECLREEVFFRRRLLCFDRAYQDGKLKLAA